MPKITQLGRVLVPVTDQDVDGNQLMIAQPQ